MTRNISIRVVLLVLSGLLLSPATAFSSSYQIRALNNEKTMAGMPNRVQYNVNDFYSVYYVYICLIRALDVDKHLSREQISQIINRMITLLKHGKAPQLIVPDYPGDGPLRVTVRVNSAKHGPPFVMIISNYNAQLGKTVSGKALGHAYGSLFYLIKDKLVKYQYITNKKERLKDARKSPNNMADYELLNEKSNDDAKGKALLIASLRKKPAPMDRFMMNLTLMEYYLMDDEVRQAKMALHAARQVIATEHNGKTRDDMKLILPYGEDILFYFVRYKHSG